MTIHSSWGSRYPKFGLMLPQLTVLISNKKVVFLVIRDLLYIPPHTQTYNPLLSPYLLI